MSTRRFFLPADCCANEEIVLTDREAHHAADVLRLHVGDRAEILDGAGGELLCEAREVARRQIRLAVIERRHRPALPYQLTLLQAIPKGHTMDLIVQKATELGAARIVPLLTERTITRLDEGSAEAKVEKWHQVAIEAVKQCGNPWLPEIAAPQTPAEFLARRETFDLPLIAALQDERRHPRACFAEFHARHARPPQTLCVWIGPEGDFSPAELRQITSAGALPVTLGPLILRSDTAACYALSVLSYELQSGVEALASGYPTASGGPAVTMQNS